MYKLLYLSFYDADRPSFAKKYHVEYFNIFDSSPENDSPIKSGREYDIIIIGGGVAGIPKASDLSLYVPEIHDFIKSQPVVLGICYGMQLLYHLYYNKHVQALPFRHQKIDDITLSPEYPLGKEISSLRVRFNHRYFCPDVSEGIVSQYYLPECDIVFPNVVQFATNHYGCQFHFTNTDDQNHFLDVLLHLFEKKNNRNNKGKMKEKETSTTTKMKKQVATRAKKLTAKKYPEQIPNYKKNPTGMKGGDQHQDARVTFSLENAMRYYFGKPNEFLVDQKKELQKAIREAKNAAYQLEKNTKKFSAKVWADIILKMENVEAIEGVLKIRSQKMRHIKQLPSALQKGRPAVRLRGTLDKYIKQNHF